MALPDTEPFEEVSGHDGHVFHVLHVAAVECGGLLPGCVRDALRNRPSDPSAPDAPREPMEQKHAQ